ncbi:hypothetical protein [Erwinia sorbitola]|uniref:Transporter n=1 Tax=Erwinia sorbitola TaxID=2681984 RepID=A0A6I6EGY7_9GAMM|nr:hypothetical protein [Erwinia sorbitola]MTD28077.1 hypothetical protein [Erwinia sorbitola]QGU85771.1 hypothetical protein GN242_00400 [Erwinia sorbitola]
MTADITIIRNKTLAFLGSALFLCLMMGLVFVDVAWMNDAVREASLTEATQEVILLVITLLFFFRAWRSPAQRQIDLLVGGFFGCMLIREMDFLFDNLSHGSWFWFALTLTLACVATALRDPRAIVSGLAAFMSHPAWGMMSAGMLTILVFSRLFGVHQLWEHLMLGSYTRTVKNMAEEGSELLGYTLCLFATIHYFWLNKRHT